MINDTTYRLVQPVCFLMHANKTSFINIEDSKSYPQQVV